MDILRINFPDRLPLTAAQKLASLDDDFVQDPPGTPSGREVEGTKLSILKLSVQLANYEKILWSGHPEERGRDTED